jgi:hypothetical protein
MIRPECIGHPFPIRDRKIMTNRRNKIEIENVHNLIHRAEIKWLFVFFLNFNRTVLICPIFHKPLYNNMEYMLSTKKWENVVAK